MIRSTRFRSGSQRPPLTPVGRSCCGPYDATTQFYYYVHTKRNSQWGVYCKHICLVNQSQIEAQFTTGSGKLPYLGCNKDLQMGSILLLYATEYEYFVPQSKRYGMYISYQWNYCKFDSQHWRSTKYLEAQRFVRYDDDVIKWKYFPRYWPFLRGIHRSVVNSPSQRPVTRSFDVFFDLRPNKWLSKQSWGWWFETPSCPLLRRCNDPLAIGSEMIASVVNIVPLSVRPLRQPMASVLFHEK